jgi:hypothetical protein
VVLQEAARLPPPLDAWNGSDYLGAKLLLRLFDGLDDRPELPERENEAEREERSQKEGSPENLRAASRMSTARSL